MRIFGVLSIGATLVFGLYYMYLQNRAMASSGRPKEAVSLAGVRTDLMQIGQGERGYIALNGKCASLDELISSNSLTMTRPERDGYSYTVDCSGTDFTVTAHHPEPTDGGARYQTLTLDSTLAIRESY